jgi:hypothetical protein
MTSYETGIDVTEDDSRNIWKNDSIEIFDNKSFYFTWSDTDRSWICKRRKHFKLCWHWHMTKLIQSYNWLLFFIFNDESYVWISLICCKNGAILNNSVNNSNGWSVEIQRDRNE